MDNLDRDVKEALRLGYGVHYGHYKIDHPHTRDDSMDIPPIPKHSPKKCPGCGREFVPGRTNQNYCSEECRQESSSRRNMSYQRRKNLNLPLGPAVCLSCGSNFVRKKKHQETCGRSCAARIRNLRRYNSKEETT